MTTKTDNELKPLSAYASYQVAQQYIKRVEIWGDASDNASIWSVLQTWINNQKWQADTLDSAVEEVNAALERTGLFNYAKVRGLIGGPVAFLLKVNNFNLTFFN
jgi:hypothetical protein